MTNRVDQENAMRMYIFLMVFMVLMTISLKVNAVVETTPPSNVIDIPITLSDAHIDNTMHPLTTTPDYRNKLLVVLYGEAHYVDMPWQRDILKGGLSDAECLAYNIYHEARGESTAGQEIVAQTTMNRVRMPYWDDNVCDVVTERNAFSWTRDGRPDLPTDMQAYRKALEIALTFIYDQKIVDHPYADRITNYHTPAVNPTWWGVKRIGQIDNHIIYKRLASN